MSITQDWIMRQIEALAQFVAKLLFNKNVTAYEIEDENFLTETDELFRKITVLLEKKDVCSAEDLLFDSFTPTREFMRLAVWFYNTLNAMTDDELREHNFSRDEIYEGLSSVTEMYGIPIKELMGKNDDNGGDMLG